MLEHDCHLSPEDGCEVCDEIFNNPLTKMPVYLILNQKVNQIVDDAKGESNETH